MSTIACKGPDNDHALGFKSGPLGPLRNSISHKNREISILMIKKRQSEVNTSSTSHIEFQTMKQKRTKYKETKN
jgi:hypothetical protein